MCSIQTNVPLKISWPAQQPGYLTKGVAFHISQPPRAEIRRKASHDVFLQIRANALSAGLHARTEVPAAQAALFKSLAWQQYLDPFQHAKFEITEMCFFIFSSDISDWSSERPIRLRWISIRSGPGTGTAKLRYHSVDGHSSWLTEIRA